jgi:hypothetical protein
VQFTHFEIKSDHTEYFIKISDSDQTWVQSCRYSDLERIHNMLKMKNKDLPVFPPKKWTGNNNPTFVSQRQKSLEHYVHTLIKYTERYDSTVLLNFLMQGKHRPLKQERRRSSALPCR